MTEMHNVNDNFTEMSCLTTFISNPLSKIFPALWSMIVGLLQYVQPQSWF
uniref:Uncharacterized protein n=1 Tax=Anguilla anguilla TaxID=7936 RepID=A0A0E9VV34_ANGAN